MKIDAYEAPFTIRRGSIDEVLLINAQIPEFDKTLTKDAIFARLNGLEPLALVACVGEQLVGYKIGYFISDSEFYSWLGGVTPQYRKNGIANKLREKQESLVAEAGISVVKVKSMNRFPGMLQLLLSNGYKIEGYEDKGNIDNSKILFRKSMF